MTKRSTSRVPDSETAAADAQPAKGAAAPAFVAPPDAPSAEAPYIPPESEAAVLALLDVYKRACAMLGLGGGEQTVSRRVALAILTAALAGENDLDRLYALALKAAAN
jgi:hypothetical protein